MPNLSEKSSYTNFLAENAALFKCPLCSESMRVVEEKSLLCNRQHCFDLARQGYVNFLTQPHKTKYNKPRFNARSTLIKNGLFSPLIERISQTILTTHAKNPALKIIDAGCGEGSLLSQILGKLKPNSVSRPLGVGMDISKEGIQLAAKRDRSALWCVADIARCPFKDAQFNCIINILSPANYVEFKRLLTDQGTIIKVVPGNRHLKELREFFHAASDKATYSNQKIINLFRTHLAIQDVQQLRYTVNLNRSLIPALVLMTPLTWNITDKEKQAVLALETLEVTVELFMLTGKSKINKDERG